MINENCKYYGIEELKDKMEIIASGRWKYYADAGKLGKTHLAQDKNSGEYFLFDQFSIKFRDQERVELKQVETNLDKKALKMIFKHTRGLLSKTEFEEDVDFQSKSQEISMNRKNIDLI